MSAPAAVLAPAVDPLRAGTLAGLHEVYADADAAVYCADALALARALPDASVDLIAPDLPYYRVKDEEWDRAWKNERAFLLWVRDLCREYRRILKPNGSLYLFASPKMAAGVERVVARHFWVLNRISWRKHDGTQNEGGLWSRADKETLRRYFEQKEEIIFAEQRDGFARIVRDARHAAGLTARDLTAAAGAHGRVNNGGAVSNWELRLNTPTPEQWAGMRRALPNLPTYDDAVRPFYADPRLPHTDVWNFATVAPYPGKRECEKPLPLCEHIVRTSSRPGDVVFDNTCGSGQMGRAALNLGRRVILGDNSLHWARRSADRLAQGSLLSELEVA